MMKSASDDSAHTGLAYVDAICLSDVDTVATVLRPVAAGEMLRVRCPAQLRSIRAVEAIPFCHKVSLVALADGATVFKYGHGIGRTLAAIGPGQHVHIHNMRSNRAQK